MTDWSLEESMATQPNLAIVDDVYGEAADLYVNILGVPPDADLGTIQLAFLDRRQEFFQALSEATNEELRETLENKLDAVVMTYRILGDEELRVQYDELRPSRLALQEMMIREMRRKKKKKKSSSSSSKREKNSPPTSAVATTPEPLEVTPVPVTPPTNQASGARNHHQQYAMSPSQWEEPFDVKHHKETAPPSPEARPRSKRAVVMAESRNADNSAEYPVPAMAGSSDSHTTRVSIEQNVNARRSDVDSPTAELALRTTRSSESGASKKSSPDHVRRSRAADEFKENMVRTRGGASEIPMAKNTPEPIHNKGSFGPEHTISKAVSADTAIAAAKVNESRTDKTTVPAARSYESRVTVSSGLKVRKAAIPAGLKQANSAESRPSRASIGRARSSESKVSALKSSEAKMPELSQDCTQKVVSNSGSQENAENLDDKRANAMTPESTLTKSSSAESRSSRAAVEAQVRAKYGRSKARKKEEPASLWSNILSAVSSETQHSTEDNGSIEASKNEQELPHNSAQAESESKFPSLVSPEVRNHPWIEHEVHSRSMLLRGTVGSKDNDRASDNAAISSVQPESREPEARRQRAPVVAPEVHHRTTNVQESKRRRSPPNPDGHYKLRSSDLNEKAAPKSSVHSHDSGGRVSTRVRGDPPEIDFAEHDDPPTLQIAPVIIPPIDSDTEDIVPPPRVEHDRPPILRPPPALKSSLSPKGKSVFDGYDRQYDGEVSFEKRPIVTFDCPPDKDPSDDHTDETIMTDDEARTVDDYFDDNMTINSQGTLVCRAEQGFFKRVTDDFYDAIEDTGRTFEQVINAFTLNEEDIKAVQMRIDRARIEMNMGVNVD